MNKAQGISAGVAAALLAIAALPLAACHSEPAASGKPGGPPPPAPVRAAKAESSRVPVAVTAFGTVEPVATIELKAQVGGEIVEVLFKEGDTVVQGQELFKIDPRPFEVALAQAEANVARFEAQLGEAQAGLRENDVRAQNAQIELGRNKTLLEREIVTQEEYDQARTMAEAMRAATGGNAAGVASAREEIRAAIAAVDQAKLNLEYCTLRSPIDGRTGNLMYHRGDVVRMGAAEPLVVITQTKPINVSFTLPERYLPQLRLASSAGDVAVRASIPQSGVEPVMGKLTFIDNSVDRVTSTIRLKAEFENGDELLWPGQYIDLSIELEVLEDVVTIPAEAVQVGQSGEYVYALDAELKATERPVKTGPTVGALVVIEEGLAAGESVVTEGHLRVTEGAAVKLLDAEAPVEQPAP